jgi:hypothetical protein
MMDGKLFLRANEWHVICITVRVYEWNQDCDRLQEDSVLTALTTMSGSFEVYFYSNS